MKERLRYGTNTARKSRMELRELYLYKMNAEDSRKWKAVTETVLDYCHRLGILQEYGQLVETTLATSVYYEHSAGYHPKEGYYYIENGDRDALFLSCNTEAAEEICFFMMHKRILSVIGRKLELENRAQLEKEWKWNTKYESRKTWFEYDINNLRKLFSEEDVEPIVAEYTGYMNRWFEDEHWRYEPEKGEFMEVSNSEKQGVRL